MSFLTPTWRKAAFDFSTYLQRYCCLPRPGGMLVSTLSASSGTERTSKQHHTWQENKGTSGDVYTEINTWNSHTACNDTESCSFQVCINAHALLNQTSWVCSLDCCTVGLYGLFHKFLCQETTSSSFWKHKKIKILLLLFQGSLIYFLLCKWIYYHNYYYLVIFSCITYYHQVVSLTNHHIISSICANWSRFLGFCLESDP